jgi:uncharacterized protein YdhG (YjbR/CyaY superfamily)
MRTSQRSTKDIDEYIAGFSTDVQEILHRIRDTIKKAAPDAEEAISYKMPTFNLNGHYLIYFAAYKEHIGLYPAPIGNEDFEAEMSAYQSGRGTLQFPLDQPIPYRLIHKIVKFRVKDNLERATAKAGSVQKASAKPRR